MQPRDLSEWEMLKNPVPQFLVEFDIKQLPMAKRMTRARRMAKKMMSMLRQGNDEQDGTNRKARQWLRTWMVIDCDAVPTETILLRIQRESRTHLVFTPATKLTP